MRQLAFCLLCVASPALAADVTPPRVLDERLTLELFVAEPDLVTPTGIAVDARGRVLVIESHTHFPPEGYRGPKADRIRLFEDTDGDGRADRAQTFYEGTRYTMSLAVYHDGSVFVATRAEIFRLHDTDGDGKADRRVPIVRLDTPGNYPHNGLSGFAFDLAGNVYFGLGENLGADYRLIGSDGTVLTGGGEGGNIYRCRADGSALTHVATGFWNPFHLCFDAFGRLLAVDNDPDSRPPCRLLHIVPGGDYGYRFRNGRKGLHPFTAWNGELPGTLPMVSGTGEAPSGMVAYESDNLPADFRGDLLITSWGDHRIERYRLTRRGGSLGGTMTPVVAGGENFRPVGIAIAPDGSLFVSDWVDRSYEVHGKGRIWRLSAAGATKSQRPADSARAIRSPHGDLRQAAARRLAAGGEKGKQALVSLAKSSEQPRLRALAVMALAQSGGGAKSLAKIARDDPSPEVRALAVSTAPLAELELVKLAGEHESSDVRAAALRRISADEHLPVLLAGLDNADPFVRQAARTGLKNIENVADLLNVTSLESPAQRLGVLLVLRELNESKSHRLLPKLLKDADPSIRFAAVQWVAEANLSQYRANLQQAMTGGATTRPLFEAYLAALERLDGGRRESKEEWSGQEYVIRVLTEPGTSLPVRRLALRVLRPDHPQLTIELLDRFLNDDDALLRLEAVRSLRESPLPGAKSRLAKIAAGTKFTDQERAEAILGIAPGDDDQRRLLVALATDRSPAVAREALRSLRGAPLDDEARSRLRQLLRSSDARPADVYDLAARVLQPNGSSAAPRTSDVDAWLRLLVGEADAARGERVFFHPRAAGCHRCHQVDGRGGQIGSDLSRAPLALTRRRLVESIVQPSKEIAPQFVTWSIATVDGRTLTGVLVGEEVDGTQRYADTDGNIHRIKPAQIDERRPNSKSIMPENLAEMMTVQEFRDLLAFLLHKR